MKTIVFVMILSAPGFGTLPPTTAPMASLEECYERVEKTTKAFAEIDNETFNFVAGCRIESRKLDPT